MWTIYLLFLLQKVTVFISVLCGLSGVASFIGIILSVVAASEDPTKHDSFSTNERAVITKIRKTALRILIPCLFFVLTMPSAKQIAIIWSVGNTIEYIQGNEKIKELPDKAVQCLDKFIDDYLNEEKQ